MRGNDIETEELDISIDTCVLQKSLNYYYVFLLPLSPPLP